MTYWDKVLKKFGISEYHKQGIFGEGVSMYVIDTGMNKNESDLQNVKVRSFAVGGSRKVHGSAVTSIIKTIISPKAQIYLADIDTTSGIIYTSSLVNAIRDAIKLNVDIITISLGTNKYDQHLQDAVNEAYTKGILIFAAAGNCACPDYEFPAACEHAISVGSINPDTGIPSAFNTRNDSNILFAPGENVLIPQNNSTQGTKSYMKVSGTSFSAPFVAGLAALVLSKNRQTEPGFRMQRENMISLLRDKDHLDLSCKVHNYSRDSSCTSSLVTLEEQSEPLIQSHTFAILLAFTILSLAFVYAFFRN